jgi:hypothetical protein
MTTKTDVKKLLSKGLTGKEAGKLVLQDNWEYDHMRDDFLSERDLSAIKSSLKTTQDIQDYNSYVNTYKIIDYTLKDAHIKALELQVRMRAVIQLILMYLFDNSSEIGLLKDPVIMTEKEYQDAKARQREDLLKDLSSIDDVILRRAWKTLPQEILDQEPEDEYLLEWLRRDHPDLWKQVVSDILELLKANKLKPVLITGRDKEDLTLLWDRIKEIQAELPINKLSEEDLHNKLDQDLGFIERGELLPEEHIDKELKSLHNKNEALMRSLYKAGKGKTDQAGLISSLEKILDGSLSLEEEDEILLYSFCSGEDLYQAGLPECIEWIDTFKPDLDINWNGIAILKDPKPGQVDERGYYKKFHDMEELSDKLSSGDFDFYHPIRMAKEEIKLVLGFQSIIQAVSEVIGIDFTEDIKIWIKDVKDIIEEYNRLRLRIQASDNISENIKDAIQPISLEKLSPSAKTIKYLRERLARSLGEGWWEDVKDALIEDLKEKEAQGG